MRSALIPCLLVLISFGCDKQGGSQSVAPEDDAGESAADSDADAALGGESHAIVGRELPQELLADLRVPGGDADGRLVTLAPSFVATAACSDCGAPSYLRILAVRCSDSMHCEVLSEECEGSIARDAERYELEFRAVEGAPEGSSEVCAAYTGSYELP